MGISSCKSCSCNDKINEMDSQIIEPTNNIDLEIEKEKKNIIQNYSMDKNKCYTSFNKNQENSNKNEGETFEGITGRICNNKELNAQNILQRDEIKLFLKEYNIKKISFPIDIDKLNIFNKNSFKKIQIILNGFIIEEDHQINKLEEEFVDIIFNISNNINYNLDKGESLYKGELKKIIYNNSFKNPIYSDRFCVLYPNALKYYKSEIHFLKNLKPLSVIYLKQINRINIGIGNNNKIDHIILCNKIGLINEHNNNLNDMYTINKSLIVFQSDDEEVIYKWYCSILYLIELYKK